jgi:hypothetical protein
MTRKALIIYCDNTQSGELSGPSHDFENYQNYLKSHLGGEFHQSLISLVFLDYCLRKHQVIKKLLSKE